jgi:hypothetical protein
MKPKHPITPRILASACLLAIPSLQAGHEPARPAGASLTPAGGGAAAERSDLTLANLFTLGWDEPWSKRPHPDGAPDMTLLKVQSNLLLYSLRTDYFFERMTPSNRDRHIQFVNQLFEFSPNRRVMFGAFGNFQWLEGRARSDREGGAYGALARLQLVDRKNTSYAFNLRAAAPNEGIGEKQTGTSVALAGWHDLTPLGLRRVGLYWHVQEETWMGPSAPGGRRNDLTYDLTLAKTWSAPTATLENFTTFLEAFSKTDLDGPNHGHSVVTLTPGFRFNLHHHHVLMTGVDLPVSAPRPFEQILRFTYIYSF